MSRKRKIVSAVVLVTLLILCITGIRLTAASGGHTEEIGEIMKDAVLHEHDKIRLFGNLEVNPGLISAFIMSGTLILFALIVRIFVIPKFTLIPGKFQYALEKAVGLFTGLAKDNSPHKSGFIGAYIFTAGVYIFLSTLFELLGLQAVTVSGNSVALPAPLADINGALGMGLLSYGVILFGGIICGGFKGAVNALKDFSLPISLSFRLFGALLSGALVTELVYYNAMTSYVVPVIVGVLFTLIHAVIQAYVLTMLVSTFFGESTEKHEKKPKNKKKKEDKKMKKQLLALLAVCMMAFALASPALAAETKPSLVVIEKEEAAQEDNSANSVTKMKAIAAGTVIAIVAGAGAAAMSHTIGKASDDIARQPEAAGNIRTNTMLGLVFIETAIIYALIVAILIVFVL